MRVRGSDRSLLVCEWDGDPTVESGSIDLWDAEGASVVWSTSGPDPVGGWRVRLRFTDISFDQTLDYPGPEQRSAVFSVAGLESGMTWYLDIEGLDGCGNPQSLYSNNGNIS